MDTTMFQTVQISISKKVQYLALPFLFVFIFQNMLNFVDKGTIGPKKKNFLCLQSLIQFNFKNIIVIFRFFSLVTKTLNNVQNELFCMF